MTDKLDVPATESGIRTEANGVAGIEQRLSRLEDAVAHLQDTRSLEERVVERLKDRLTRDKNTSIRDVTGVILDSSRNLLPAVVANPLPAKEPSTEKPSTPRSMRRPWLLFELWAEARAIIRMYVDPRYQLSWSGRLIPLFLVAVILTSSFWIPGTSFTIIGPVFDKTLNLALGFVLFKILGHEARRYRETAPDLPPSLRL